MNKDKLDLYAKSCQKKQGLALMLYRHTIF